MKSKMASANMMNDMTLANVKSQTSSQQMRMLTLMQKVGKGKRKVTISLSNVSQKYLFKLVEEMKKQLKEQEKQWPNVFSFLNYLQNSVSQEKGKKKEKVKNVALSYEELDLLKIQTKETIKGIKDMKSKLKWFNLMKKSVYSALLKQNEMFMEELAKAK